MGKTAGRKPPPDYAEVIRVIEHHLQCRTPSWPYDSHQETAQALESGDAHRALVEIGAALDEIKGLPAWADRRFLH